jgi:hypothetical protein
VPVRARRLAALVAIVAFLATTWATVGHGASLGAASASAPGHACCGHCHGAPHEGSDGRDGDHDPDECALCKVHARLPNLAPSAVVLPKAAAASRRPSPDAPEAPDSRRVRLHLPRGPPPSAAT